MQNEISWLTVILVLGPAFITGLSTALASLLLFRHQRKMKVEEVQAQAALKGREILFESYQRKIDRLSKNAEEFGESLGKFAGYLQSTEDENERQQATTALLLLIRMTAEPLRDLSKELQTELNEVGLGEKRKNDMAFVTQTLSTDLEKVSPSDFGQVYLDFMKALGLLYSLRDELLQKKCEDLFSSYLPPSSEKIIRKLR